MIQFIIYEVRILNSWDNFEFFEQHVHRVYDNRSTWKSQSYRFTAKILQLRAQTIKATYHVIYIRFSRRDVHHSGLVGKNYASISHDEFSCLADLSLRVHRLFLRNDSFWMTCALLPSATPDDIQIGVKRARAMSRSPLAAHRRSFVSPSWLHLPARAQVNAKVSLTLMSLMSLLSFVSASS